MLANGRRLALERARSMNRELIESEARLNMVVDANMDAVVRLDDSGTVIGWGGGSEAVFGFSKEEALGRKLSELVIPERCRHDHESAFDRLADFDPEKSNVC